MYYEASTLCKFIKNFKYIYIYTFILLNFVNIIKKFMFFLGNAF